jgi:hypothetical protein
LHSGGAVAKHWRHPPPPVIAHSYVDARAGVCLHEYHSRWGAVGHSMQRGAWGGSLSPWAPRQRRRASTVPVWKRKTLRWVRPGWARGPSLAVNSGSVDYLIACLEGESVVVQRAAGTSLTPPLRTPWTQQKGRARYYGHALVSCVSAGVYIRPHGVWGDVTSTGAGCGRWGSIIRAVSGLLGGCSLHNCCCC